MRQPSISRILVLLCLAATATSVLLLPGGARDSAEAASADTVATSAMLEVEAECLAVPVGGYGYSAPVTGETCTALNSVVVVNGDPCICLSMHVNGSGGLCESLRQCLYEWSFTWGRCCNVAGSCSVFEVPPPNYTAEIAFNAFPPIPVSLACITSSICQICPPIALGCCWHDDPLSKSNAWYLTACNGVPTVIIVTIKKNGVAVASGTCVMNCLPCAE
jgi:hypothetical protein